MYKVIVAFVDLQDNGHRYNAGDIFPRKGVEVPEYRIDKLSSNKNRRKMPLIEKVGEEVETTEEVVEIVAEPEVEADEAPFMNQPEETVEPEIEKVEEKAKSGRKGKQK